MTKRRYNGSHEHHTPATRSLENDCLPYRCIRHHRDRYRLAVVRHAARLRGVPVNAYKAAINQAWQSLTIALEHAGFEGVDEEQTAALEDVTQWPGMLEDMEARLGIDVSEAREILAAHVGDESEFMARIETLEDEIEYCREDDRDTFARATGELEEVRGQLASLYAAKISAKVARTNFRLWISEDYATGSNGETLHAVEIRHVRDLGKPGIFGPTIRHGADLCELLRQTWEGGC